EDLAIPVMAFNSLAKSARLKARAILQGNKVGQPVASAPEIRAMSAQRCSAKDLANAACQARPAAPEVPLQKVLARSPRLRASQKRKGVVGSRATRENRIYVISFRLTHTELELLRQCSGEFKSLNRAARGLMTEVLHLGESRRIDGPRDTIDSFGGCRITLE